MTCVFRLTRLCEHVVHKKKTVSPELLETRLAHLTEKLRRYLPECERIAPEYPTGLWMVAGWAATVNMLGGA